jgi:hypothetical protein
MAQAKIFHEQLDISTPQEYSSGWYGKFKKRHGLHIVALCGNKALRDYDANEAYFEELSQLVTGKHMSAQQVYNVDKTSLF